MRIIHVTIIISCWYNISSIFMLMSTSMPIFIIVNISTYRLHTYLFVFWHINGTVWYEPIYRLNTVIRNYPTQAAQADPGRGGSGSARGGPGRDPLTARRCDSPSLPLVSCGPDPVAGSSTLRSCVQWDWWSTFCVMLQHRRCTEDWSVPEVQCERRLLVWSVRAR